jgi:hypothetical protein
MKRKMQIGFTQRLQLKWLDRTAGLLLAGNARPQIKVALTDLLKDQLSVDGTEGRGSRDKTVTILLKTWVTVPRYLEALRDDGLAHLRRLPSKDHLPVHWGMAMAAYPFFSVVAETVGRLIRLQTSAAAAQVQRRVRELLGERETVSRATRRILRTFIDWGVLSDADDKGVYEAMPKQRIKDARLGAWLVEASLVASDCPTATIEAALQAAALFPFALPRITAKDFEATNRLEVFRQGGDLEALAFRHNGKYHPPGDADLNVLFSDKGES